ncbi:MAG: hypothetical protein ACRDM7_12825 [Thermoleophilaceae bacterium]
MEAPTTVDDYGSVAGALVAGALVFLVWAHIIGVLRWGFRRARKHPGSYAQTTYSWGVMVTAVVLLFFGSVGRGAQLLEQEEEAATASAPAAQTETEQARNAYVEWFDGFMNCVELRGTAITHYDGFIKALTRDDAAAFDRLDAMERRFTEFGECIADETITTDATLDGISEDLMRSADVGAASATSYRRAITMNYDLKRLEAGDAQIRRSQRLIRSAGREGDRYYKELGGADVFEGRIDFDRIVALMREK